jgi:hypothetical protein
MIDEVSNVIMNIGMVTAILPLLALFIIFSKAHRRSWWALFIIVIIWFVAEALNWIFAANEINNLMVFHLFAILSIVAYSNLYFKLINNKRFRIILIISIVLIETFLIGHLFLNALWLKTSMIITMTGVLVPFLLSIVFFYELMLNPVDGKLTGYPYYWINTAILIHFGMAFFTLIFIERIVGNSELTLYLWPIVSISNIIYNILLSKGIWQMKQA